MSIHVQTITIQPLRTKEQPRSKSSHPTFALIMSLFAVINCSNFVFLFISVCCEQKEEIQEEEFVKLEIIRIKIQLNRNALKGSK
jgi:hypothetical protein